MALHGPVRGVLALVGTAETAGGLSLAIRWTVGIAALGTDDFPTVRIRRDIVPGSVLGLVPAESKWAKVREVGVEVRHATADQ